MKIKINLPFALLVATLATAAVSCKKENAATDVVDASTITSSVASTQAIAVAASTTGTSTTDSIYVVNTCGPRAHRDSIAFSSLPASVTSYLTTNYAGYTGQKAFTVKDATGTLQGYVVIVQYNGKPVGLKFDSNGNFVQVLEQRMGRDLLSGGGWHQGCPFDDRDGMRRDTVALSALPAAIKSYFAANYPTDTLVRAFKNKDTTYAILSINNGVYATLFDATGNFIKRVQLPAKPGRPQTIELSALPANVQSYLTTTYPNYVFKQAFKITVNNALQGYVVFIDANNTKYAVEFDASGNFVAAKTVR